MGTRSGQLSSPRGVKKARSGNNIKAGSVFERFLLSFVYLAFITAFVVSTSAQDSDNIASTLRTGTSEQKRDVLFQIRNLQTEQASRLAIPALNDKDEIVRATAASAVVYLPSAEAAQALIPLLNDQKPFVRKEAAYSLGKTRDQSAVTSLLRLLEKEKDLEVKSAAVMALGDIGNVSAVELLVKLLGSRPTEDNEFLRRSAARSIGQITQIVRTGDRYIVTPQNFLPDQFKQSGGRDITAEFPVLAAAVVKLSQILANKDESDDTRREAAFALGAIGSTSSINILQTSQTSSDPYLAEISKEALLKIVK